MGQLEEVSEAHDRVERCAYLVVHIVQERILDGLYFLCLLRLFLQQHLRVFLFAHVTTDTEIVIIIINRGD